MKPYRVRNVSDTLVRHMCHVYFKVFATCPCIMSISMLPCLCNIDGGDAACDEIGGDDDKF